MTALRVAVVLVFLVSAGYFIVTSLRWPLMCDSPVMHYVNFLMDHGMQPYHDITDNNMPGSYLTEWWAMRVFGGGDLAWRIYDFFLLTVLTGAMVTISRGVDWVAGIYAGGFFLVIYGAQGPNYSVEREQVITTLFLVGYALLFIAVRRSKPLLLLPFGLAAAMACSMKPTFTPLALALLGMVLVVLKRRHGRVGPYLGWALIGFGISLSLNVGFLLRHHALANFWFVLRTITPSYVALAQPHLGVLLRAALPPGLTLLVLAVGIPLAWLNRGWDWERWALLLGALFGLLSYLLQHKGFLHHKYAFETFVLLLLGIELMRGLQRPGWPRLLGSVGVLITLLLFVPHYLHKLHTIPGSSLLTEAMERDLDRLGGAQELQGQVQCFDLVFGCLNSLYHLGLVENTGFTGDLLFFSPQGGAAATYYRTMFWDLAHRDPANVLVMTNEWFGRPNSFGKVRTWPDFERYLHDNYTLVVARSFPEEERSFGTPPGGEIAGYRIYVRNASALLPRASAAFERP